MTEGRLVSLAAALTNSEPERPRLPPPLHFLSLQRADASTQFSTPFGSPAPSHEVAGGILRIRLCKIEWSPEVFVNASGYMLRT